jgi:hypothetical protein
MKFDIHQISRKEKKLLAHLLLHEKLLFRARSPLSYLSVVRESEVDVMCEANRKGNVKGKCLYEYQANISRASIYQKNEKKGRRYILLFMFLYKCFPFRIQYQMEEKRKIFGLCRGMCALSARINGIEFGIVCVYTFIARERF